MTSLPVKVAVVGVALVAPLVMFPAPASAHPFGMCHVAGKSGVVVYLPPGAAANAHERLRQRDVHADDYSASRADADDFRKTGNRKCAASRVNPTG